MLSCVSPENYEKNLNEIKSLGVNSMGYTNTFIK